MFVLQVCICVCLLHLLYSSGADPENCFGRGTLDLSRQRQRSETPKVLRGVSGQGVYSLPRRLGHWGSVVSSPSGGVPTANVFWGLHTPFVRFNPCFSAFWNPARPTKPTRSDYFCRPLVWRGHVSPVPPVWIRPWYSSKTPQHH